MPNSIKKLEEAFKEGKYDQLLKDIYVDEAVIEYQQERCQQRNDDPESLTADYFVDRRLFCHVVSPDEAD